MTGLLCVKCTCGVGCLAKRQVASATYLLLRITLPNIGIGVNQFKQ